MFIDEYLAYLDEIGEERGYYLSVILDMINIAGVQKVSSILNAGFFVDLFHPYLYVMPRQLNTYSAREEFINTHFNTRIHIKTKKCDFLCLLHPIFIIAEFEHFIRIQNKIHVRNLTDRRHFHHFLYNHYWDKIIDELFTPELC
jgi:hypothetical protein